MRKSLSLRMFPPEMDVLRRLDIAAEAGFDGVEVNLEPWWAYSLASTDAELRTLHRAIAARGLRVSTVYDREQWHYPMTSRDPAVRSRCREIVAGLVHAATILETDVVLVMPGAVDNGSIAPQPEITPYADAYANALEVLRDLGRTVCRQAQVHLAAENCPGKFLISPLEFAQFLDQVDSPWVHACFDTGNALWYGFPEHWIPVLGPRIKRVHVKDNRAVAPGGVVATPLLAGDVNWPAVCRTLADIGYGGWLIAEVYPHYTFYPERLIFETSASMDVIFEPCQPQEAAHGAF